jgi:hypothetical protein
MFQDRPPDEKPEALMQLFTTTIKRIPKALLQKTVQ